MPLYEYECDACGQRFEVIQKFSDPPPETCTKCGKGPVTRLFSSPAIQFKGSGWYITDYAQKGKSGGDAAGSGKSSGSGNSESSGESKGESKSESKSDSKSDGGSTASAAKSESSTPTSTTPTGKS